MKRTQIIFSIIVLLISIVTLALVFLKNASQNSPSTLSELGTNAGEEAADFNLTSIEGKQYTFASFKGNVILMSFWASWCGPCLSEIPYMIRLYHHFKNSNFKMILVNVEDDPTIAVNEFGPKLNINFENYYSADGKGPAIYGVSGIPHNLLIDKNFKIVLTEKGPRNWYGEEVIAMVQQLLDK